MLHAFIIKRVRRILARDRLEHSNAKNEDAITSMVFSPLAFMEAPQAMAALDRLLDGAVCRSVAGRTPHRHQIHLWPAGLQAPTWAGDGVSRCEPDLVALFTFKTGPDLVLIGEMKWDWYMAPADLRREIDREIAAVGARWPGVQLPFVLSKYPYRDGLKGVECLTWVDAANRLIPLERSGQETSPARWASLVREFLEIADIAGFGGFPSGPTPVFTSRRFAFWSATVE